MADKKIKQVQIGSTTYDVKDAAAVSSINNYSNESINSGVTSFANVAITESEIDRLLGLSTQSNS